VLAGIPGALVATAGIFLPAFIFVGVSIPLLPRIRNSPILSRFLDGVIIASLALMAAVTWDLSQAALVDITTIGLGLATGVLLFRYRINTTWLILLGIVVGILHGLIS
jgi:chromate transporter